jgi:hypothetical protein
MRFSAKMSRLKKRRTMSWRQKAACRALHLAVSPMIEFCKTRYDHRRKMTITPSGFLRVGMGFLARAFGAG